ncbi:tetratricopeptide repeat protein, partial [Rhabdothermincola sp.]|uniref:tetratricopeptide repeat protein n=1 Tax=Rhabdothermincola sp. TaxID=2820405 RepID=UPI002FE2977C
HGGARWELDREIVEQLTRAVEPARRERIERRLSEAVEAFQAERFADAARILKALADQAPGVAAIRELYGLTLYRLGRWRSAIRELEAFETLTASAEQHPVLADCHRALGHWETVDELWEELRRAAPSPELVTEGRIVTAGARADRGDLRAAIALLEQGFRYPRSPKVHHLRRAYALADLYERAGDLARSRELFARIQRDAPDFADVDDRVRALR